MACCTLRAMADIENVRSKSTEQHKLLGKDTIHVLGTEVLRNDKDYLYAIVFPIRVPGENDEQFNEIVPDAEERWKELFPTEADDPLDKMKASGVTWETFTKDVRENVVKYIGWLGCEVTEFKSVDEDEIFVLFGMKDEKKLQKFLLEEEARVRMKPAAYEWHKFQCPTDKKVGKDFVREVETDHYTLRGKDHYNDYPAFVRYTPEIDEIVEDVEETEMLRILRHALRKYCRMQLMEQVGVIRLFFPIHKWEELEELYKRRWNDPSKPLYYPKAHMPDHVAEYFGAHVASYFHFYNTMTRWLIVPGLISMIFPFVRAQLGPEKAHWLDSAFGLLMCLWTTIFLAHSKHSLNVKLLKWGMGGNVNAVTVVRKNFKDEKRGTWLESCRGLLHWALVIIFISETVVVSRWIVQYRQQIFDNIDGTTWGMKNVDVAKYFKYLITANIKIVEMVFTPLSIYLSKHENHRTEMDLKNAMILKLFAVKFVLFYYPFIRPIFIQPMVEGCPGAGATGDHFEGCINDLRQDLQIFFLTQVLSAVGGLVASVGLMFWTIQKEVKRKKSSESLLSYVEVQAMLSDYDEAAEVSDYMQAVLNFGFLSMFGAVAPSMCFLCFLSNLPMKRLLAYRFSYMQKRVIPIITVGIGSWALILNFLAFFGVTSTTFIVIFAFDILDLQTGDKWQRMCIMMMFFFSIERVLGVLKFVIDIGSGEKSVSHLRIEECNDDVRDLILANQIKKVSATPRGKSG